MQHASRGCDTAHTRLGIVAAVSAYRVSNGALESRPKPQSQILTCPSPLVSRMRGRNPFKCIIQIYTSTISSLMLAFPCAHYKFRSSKSDLWLVSFPDKVAFRPTFYRSFTASFGRKAERLRERVHSDLSGGGLFLLGPPTVSRDRLSKLNLTAH